MTGVGSGVGEGCKMRSPERLKCPGVQGGDMEVDPTGYGSRSVSSLQHELDDHPALPWPSEPEPAPSSPCTPSHGREARSLDPHLGLVHSPQPPAQPPTVIEKDPKALKKPGRASESPQWESITAGSLGYTPVLFPSSLGPTEPCLGVSSYQRLGFMEKLHVPAMPEPPVYVTVLGQCWTAGLVGPLLLQLRPGALGVGT